MRISISGLIAKLTSRSGTQKTETGAVANLPQIPSPTRNAPNRSPHHVQIGFDFGTAFSKVVIRDVNAKTARVFLTDSPESRNFPFLIPSVIYFGVDESGNAWFSRQRWHQNNEELRFPKLALCGISSNQVNQSPQRDIVQVYEKCAEAAGCSTDLFIEDAITFFMTTVLSAIVSNLKNGEMQLFSNSDDWLGEADFFPLKC